MQLPIFQWFGWKDAAKLLSSERSFLGVDIGAYSIKLVQLKKERERGVLETYGELSLAKYAGTETGRPTKVSGPKLAEALADLIRESQAKAKNVVVSISLRESFLTSIDMPMLSEAELKESIPFEARKYIPVPISEIVLDWRVLPPTSSELSESSIGSEKSRRANVLLAAVSRDSVAKYEKIFKDVGLEAIAYEIEIFSFARSSLKEHFGTVMLIDLGAFSTKMAIADGGVVRYAHSFDHGAGELTLALSQSSGVDFTRAEALKLEHGIVKKPENEGIVAALEPLIEFVAAEGERFILNWKRRGGKSVSRIVVGGGGGKLKGLEDFFVKKFGVEVAIANPFSRVVYPAFLEPALKEIGPAFTNAVGLALREF